MNELLSLYNIEQLTEMVYPDQAFMVELLAVLQLPLHVERNMDSRGSNVESWGYVALKRITHHQQFCWQDAQMAA